MRGVSQSVNLFGDCFWLGGRPPSHRSHHPHRFVRRRRWRSIPFLRRFCLPKKVKGIERPQFGCKFNVKEERQLPGRRLTRGREERMESSHSRGGSCQIAPEMVSSFLSFPSIRPTHTHDQEERDPWNHKGASIYDVRKIIHAALFRLSAFWGPPPPTHCGRHIWKPP